MLFHKDGIKWMISEISILLEIIDKYWLYSKAIQEHSQLETEEIVSFRSSLKHYASRHSGKSLEMIEVHAKNVTAHLTNEHHYKTFISDIICLDFSKLLSENEKEYIQRMITDIQTNHELLTRKCYYFHELLIKIIPEIVSLNADVQQNKEHIAIKILLNDLENCKNTLEEIETASKKMAHAIFEVQPICETAIKSIERLKQESLKTHWVYSNIGSWFDKVDSNSSNYIPTHGANLHAILTAFVA